MMFNYGIDVVETTYNKVKPLILAVVSSQVELLISFFINDNLTYLHVSITLKSHIITLLNQNIFF